MSSRPCRRVHGSDADEYHDTVMRKTNNTRQSEMRPDVPCHRKTLAPLPYVVPSVLRVAALPVYASSIDIDVALHSSYLRDANTLTTSRLDK